MKWRMLAAVLAALAWGACGDDATGLIDQLRIEGTVSALDTGDPIDNAVVTLQFPQGAGIGTITAPTRSDGGYTLTFTSAVPFSDCSQIVVSAIASGYQQAFQDVGCVREQTIDFALRPAGG